MKAFKLNTRLCAIFLILVMMISLFSACKKDEKDESGSSKASTSTTAKSKDEKSTDKDSKSETTTSSESSTSSKQKEVENATPVAAPIVPSGSSSSTPSLNTGNSTVQNATDASDLKNVDPAAAAESSFGAEVKPQEEKDVKTINPSEFTYISHDQFDNHILSVWNSFTVNEKVKVDKGYAAEYINHLSLPIKETFAEINCHGAYYYPASDDKYDYLDIEWIYYINQSQYEACKTAAKTITNKAGGTTANKVKVCHDQLCILNTYQANVDGAYNCLINNVSDCDGYTAAFKICMDILGIPCKAYATSDHIFNLVQIDGEWYAVDVTWDDQDAYGVAFEIYLLNGKNAYSAPASLVNILASSRYYSVDRKGVICNEATLKSALGAPSSYTNARFTSEDTVTFDIPGGGTASWSWDFSGN